MKKQILAAAIVALFLMVSCKNVKNTNSETQPATELNADSTSIENLSDYDECKDVNGKVLKLTFNDDASQVECDFEGTSFVLLNQVTASGARYANEEYELTQWHGITELKKGEEVIFIEEPVLVKGMLTIGHEVCSFVPCGEEKVYWVIDNTLSMVDEYTALTEDKEAFSPVYAEVKVLNKGKAVEGFSEEYDGVIEVVEVVAIQAISDNDCK